MKINVLGVLCSCYNLQNLLTKQKNTKGRLGVARKTHILSTQAPFCLSSYPNARSTQDRSELCCCPQVVTLQGIRLLVHFKSQTVAALPNSGKISVLVTLKRKKKKNVNCMTNLNFTIIIIFFFLLLSGKPLQTLSTFAHYTRLSYEVTAYSGFQRIYCSLRSL